MRGASLAVAQQCIVKVHYNDVVVGEYFADLLVDRVLVVELKAVKAWDDTHMPPGACPGGRTQCINYLKAPGLQFCLLFNFGKPRLEIKRVVHGLWQH